MITALDSRVMDANSEALGVSVETLMGNAGKAIADFISHNYPEKKIAFFCGHGNNGGDGFAAVALLPRNTVRIYCITPTDRIRSETVRKYLSMTGIEPENFRECRMDFEVLVDCGLGTGLNGPLRPEYLEYVNMANGFDGPIVSVDVPTGFGTGTAVKPSVTITMHDLKEGMNEATCGKIIIADIDMPNGAYMETGPGDMLRYPVPSPDSHKGSSGHLLIIGGGPYFGAPAMAGLSALRTGADLVTLAVPDSVFHEVASFSPVFMIDRLSGNHLTAEHAEHLLDNLDRYSAVLIGPGLGRNPETIEAVRLFVNRCTKPLVIDADALFAVSETEMRYNTTPVMTPHMGEYVRLGGTETTNDAVTDLASKLGSVILLKGRNDIISNGVESRTNRTGCSGMTGAGTGDVLAGIVGGLLAKKMTPYDAACLGAYISGKAGEHAFETLSYGMIATDIIDSIPIVINNGLKGRKN